MKDVRLPCNSVGEPVPAIKWTKDRYGGGYQPCWGLVPALAVPHRADVPPVPLAARTLPSR